MIYSKKTCGNLNARPFPSDLPVDEFGNQGYYRECPVRFRNESLVPAEPEPLEWPSDDGASGKPMLMDVGISLTKQQAEDWNSFIDERRHHVLSSHLLGYSDVWNSMGLHWFPEVQMYDVFTDAEKIEATRNTRLLLQISREIEDYTGMPLGGTVSFLIRNNDLVEQDFSHVWSESRR